MSFGKSSASSAFAVVGYFISFNTFGRSQTFRAPNFGQMRLRSSTLCVVLLKIQVSLQDVHRKSEVSVRGQMGGYSVLMKRSLDSCMYEGESRLYTCMWQIRRQPRNVACDTPRITCDSVPMFINLGSYFY